MKSVSIPALMMASLCIYPGIYHLRLFFKRKNGPVNLIFAIACFATALYDFLTVCLYNSDSISGSTPWEQLRLSTLALLSLSISWFFSYYMRNISMKIHALESILFSILFLTGILLQNNLILLLLSLGVITGTIYHSVNNREDTDKNIIPVVTSLLIFFFAALNEILLRTGTYSFVSLIEYASLILILIMGYLLQNESLELTNEVNEQNKMLKEKINDTTMELLFSNIGKELYRETFNELMSDELKSNPAVMDKIFSYDSGSSIEKISRDMSIISNMDELLNTAIKKAVEISGAEEGSFFLADSMNKHRLKAFYSITDSPSEEIDESVFQKILGDESFLIDLSDDLPPKSRLFVPVMLEDEFVGIVYLKKNIPEAPFTDQDADIISAFLAQSAIAIENAFYYQRMKNINQVKAQSSLSATSEEKIKKAVQFIEENYMYDISRENLAASIDMHPDSLSRYFKIFTGKKLGDYINEFRVNCAAEKLKETDDNIIDIAFSVGFESLTSFNRAFLKFKNTSPKKYRNG